MIAVHDRGGAAMVGMSLPKADVGQVERIFRGGRSGRVASWATSAPARHQSQQRTGHQTKARPPSFTSSNHVCVVNPVAWPVIPRPVMGHHASARLNLPLPVSRLQAIACLARPANSGLILSEAEILQGEAQFKAAAARRVADGEIIAPPGEIELETIRLERDAQAVRSGWNELTLVLVSSVVFDRSKMPDPNTDQ
jgi:hypothetical protein